MSCDGSDNPTTAAEWAEVWLDQWLGCEGRSVEKALADWLDAYARQQVEAALEAVIQWLDNEDRDNDPDDLYAGRCHRVAAIRALKPARPSDIGVLGEVHE